MRPSYLYNGNPCTGETTSLIAETRPWAKFCHGGLYFCLHGYDRGFPWLFIALSKWTFFSPSFFAPITGLYGRCNSGTRALRHNIADNCPREMLGRATRIRLVYSRNTLIKHDANGYLDWKYDLTTSFMHYCWWQHSKNLRHQCNIIRWWFNSLAEAG